MTDTQREAFELYCAEQKTKGYWVCIEDDFNAGYQAALAHSQKDEVEPVPSYEMVLAYLYSLYTEMKRRGGYFPQESDAQEASSKSLMKTADLVKWYGEQGHPIGKAVQELKDTRARNSQPPITNRKD